MSGQAVVSVLALVFAFSRPMAAQSSGSCSTDRTLSTLVGAGLGGAVAAIPATIIHRHDQTSSHLIVAVSIPTGALIGFLAAGRDRPCMSGMESPSVGDAVVATRSSHAGRGGLVGIVSGGLVGAAGGTLYNVGCERDPCNAALGRASLMLFSAGEGAIAGGILGGLIGWAWPVGR
jgi:hypothetical protein